MKVEGLTQFRRAIDETIRQTKLQQRSAVVGFTQRYAIKVHETAPGDPGGNHGPGKSWKYLETPTRALGNNGTLGKLIESTFKRTGSIEDALMRAGYRILRDAQLIVPVDTSALRASGYYCLESEHEAVANAHFAKSEDQRKAEHKKRFAKFERKRSAQIKKKQRLHRKKHRSWEKRRKAWEKKHGWNN